MADPKNDSADSKFMDLVERSRLLRIERQTTLDRLWVLEEEGRKLQNEFYQLVGSDEVGLMVRLSRLQSGETEITSLEIQKEKQRKKPSNKK